MGFCSYHTHIFWNHWSKWHYLWALVWPSKPCFIFNLTISIKWVKLGINLEGLQNLTLKMLDVMKTWPNSHNTCKANTKPRVKFLLGINICEKNNLIPFLFFVNYLHHDFSSHPQFGKKTRAQNLMFGYFTNNLMDLESFFSPSPLSFALVARVWGQGLDYEYSNLA